MTSGLFRISNFVFLGRSGPTGVEATWQCFHFWVNWSLKRVQPFLTNSKSWVSVGIKPEAGCSRSVSDRTGLFLMCSAACVWIRRTRPWVWRKQHLLFTDTETLVSRRTLRLGNTEAARRQCNSFDSSAGFWLAPSLGRSAVGLPLVALNAYLLWSLLVTFL